MVRNIIHFFMRINDNVRFQKKGRFKIKLEAYSCGHGSYVIAKV